MPNVVTEIPARLHSVASDHIVAGANEIYDDELGKKQSVINKERVAITPNQGLTEQEKANARNNIGAGSSNFSGNYNDLSNKPTIPSAQIQSDWNQTNTSSKDYIKNKPSSMPASDVSAWAKAANKPSYNLDEVSDGSTRKLVDKIGKTIETTWANLKSLRDNSQLIPGQWYRIIDYVTTTTQDDTQSAGHQFDIIVRADDVNVLNENAYAAKHEGDTYFANCNLAAWELKYTLDNIYWSEKHRAVTMIYNETEYTLTCSSAYPSTKLADGKYYYVFYSTTSISSSTTFYIRELVYDASIYKYSMGKVGTIQTIEETGEGKGTITYLKDEYGNECSYDFKNIQYKRWKVTDSKSRTYINNCYVGARTYPRPINISIPNNSDFIWCFTFTKKIEDVITDSSIDENCVFIENTIMGCENRNLLPNNVFIIFSNTSSVLFNKLGHDCIYNTFSNGGIGSSIVGNIFGCYCTDNVMSTKYVVFGNKCIKNTLNSGNCTFGNNCSNNSFVSGSNILFSNSCSNNTLYSSSNILFNDSCSNNTLCEECIHITFGQGCTNNNIDKKYTYHCIIDTGNKYITLTSTQTTSGSSLLRNIKICQGVNNTTTRKTISHDTVNDTFLTEYKPTNSQVISV